MNKNNYDQTTPFTSTPTMAEAEGSTASNSPALTHREHSGGEKEEEKENALASGILGILAPAVRHVDEKVDEVRSV